MRILFFVHRYWPSVGGVEKYVHELGRALLETGHRVDVMAGAHKENLPRAQMHEGLRIHRFPALRSPSRCRAALWRSWPLFRSAEVISVSNTHMLEYFWRMFGPLADPRKVFLIRHGMGCIYPVPDAQKRRAQRSLGLTAGVVHDGRFIEKWLDVKPDLCPDQGLRPEADELAPVPEPAPTSAIYIGRLEPDTGIRIYVDAVRRLTREHHRTFALDVYGEGTLLPELRETVARESLPVRFWGRVPNAQRHIPDSCFAFLDGRMAVQEAMARRRLVLAAYVDPLKRDYVGTESFSPYLITVGSGAELAARAAHYIDHPHERAALVNRAFAHARTLRWNRTAQSYMGFWQERLARAGRQASRWRWAKIAWRFEREARDDTSCERPRLSTPPALELPERTVESTA